DGRRWIPDPARLARRRGDPPARSALCVRSPRDETYARCRLVASAETARTAPRGTGRRARLLGPARPRDHAATVAVLRRRGGSADRGDRPRLRPEADAGLGTRDSANAPVRGRPQRPPRCGGPGGAVAHADRDRRRRTGRSPLVADPGGRPEAAWGGGGRSGGRVRPERPWSPLRRPDRALRAGHRRREA